MAPLSRRHPDPSLRDLTVMAISDMWTAGGQVV
jgi:hypothetical protein